MATKSFVNIRYNTANKTGVFCQIFPDILGLFSQSFHHMKAHYVQMMDLLFSKFGQLPSSNLGVYAVKGRFHQRELTLTIVYLRT